VIAISIGLFLLTLLIVTAYFLSLEPKHTKSVINGRIGASDLQIVSYFPTDAIDY